MNSPDRQPNEPAAQIPPDPNSPMRVGFLAPGDAREPGLWSGTPFHMARALAAEGLDIVHVGSASPRFERPLRIATKLRRRLGLSRVVHDHTLRFARHASAHATRRIARIQPDVIFAAAASAHIAYLETDVPIVYSSDATFSSVADYYPDFGGFSPRSYEEGQTIERLAMAQSHLLAYPSEWAASSARNDYGIGADELVVVPYGANLEHVPARDSLLPRPSRDTCHLLFIGVLWERKGGPMALEIAARLEALGIPTHLTIIGCAPPCAVDPARVTVIPFIDKRDPHGARLLSQHYASSDFFIFPTVAEAFGVVLCEASAHALPSIARATGGVTTVIREGHNGHLIAPDAGADAYARVIADAFRDDSRLAALRASSRREFDERLNWPTWAAEIAGQMRTIVGRGSADGAENAARQLGT